MLCASHVMSRDMRMQEVSFIQEEKRMKVKGGRKGYIHSSSCNLIRILRFVGWLTQNGSAFILHNVQTFQEWRATRGDQFFAVRTVCNAGRCFGLWDHCYRCDLVHLGTNWVLHKLPPCATIRHGYQCLTMQNAHATDVMDREYVIVRFAML
jgi:hypothetical protein